jgi:deoxyribodipyrimidine photo-lyase
VVDAAGVVPLAVSPKAEIGARTLRPKVHARLGAGLRPFPEPPAEQPSPGSLDWGFAPFLPAAGAAGEGEIDAALAALPIDHGVPPVRSVRGGAEAGLARLRRFLAERLEGYAERRNEPSLDWTSGLSPYLHAGHVGAAEVARAVSEAGAPAADREAFLEELIVRRELALNLCARVPDPGAYEALPAWARATLQAHEQDPRPVLLTDEQLERAESPDELWNAAQRQLLREGRIHGYLRMLWGKCLLTWSRDAREALRRMRWLNDRWALDGRDANGAAGFLWCLGLHDRPFPERPIFGTVRSMTSRSTRNKLDVEPYLARYGLGGPPPGGAGGLV